ncbi:MAG: hypothetical protein ABEI99_10865 [Halobaculum sp.]
MSSFDIGLYMSSKLYKNKGNTPINRAEEQIDDAINNDSEHSVTMTIQRDSGEPAPIERVGPSFEVQNKACAAPTEDKYYTACHCQGEDACILVTNGDRGGLVGINYNNYAAVVEGGQYLANLSSGDTGQGDTKAYAVANTLLHELGHSIISANVNEHKVWDTYKGSDGDYGRTAMETSAVDITENICGNKIDSASQEATGYSECAENKM